MIKYTKLFKLLESPKSMEKVIAYPQTTVTEGLGITIEELRILVEMGVVTQLKASDGYTPSDGSINVDQIFIEQTSFDTIHERSINDAQVRISIFKNPFVDSLAQLQELCRFDKDYRARWRDTKLIQMQGKYEAGSSTFSYPKVQIDNLTKDVKVETLQKAANGSIIIDADRKFEVYPKGKTVDDVITSLGLSIDPQNRNRICRYYLQELTAKDKEDTQPVLNLQDQGKIMMYIDQLCESQEFKQMTSSHDLKVGVSS